MARAKQLAADAGKRAEVLALLRAAKEQPEEDAPRLILADWLEDHGAEEARARAELIRVQCRLEHLAEGAAERGALLNREHELLDRYGAAWRQAFSIRGISVTYRRGLLYLKLSSQAFLAQSRQRLAGTEVWGWVEGVCLVHRYRRWPVEILQAPALADVFALDVSQTSAKDHGVKALAASPRVAHLTFLGLNRTYLGWRGAEALNSPHLARLRTLRLARNYLGLRGVTALASAEHLAGLTSLDLSVNNLGNDEAKRFATYCCLTRLTSLHLHHNRIGPPGARALVAAASLARLTQLDLSHNAIRDAGALALAQSPHLTGLTDLDLTSNGIGPRGAQALAASPGLANLTRLELSLNALGDEGARALAASPYLNRLVALEVWGNSISKEGARLLRDRFGAAVLLDE
jgi:uncharacterized protein (TIGR02996 family)